MQRYMIEFEVSPKAFPNPPEGNVTVSSKCQGILTNCCSNNSLKTTNVILVVNIDQKYENHHSH